MAIVCIKVAENAFTDYPKYSKLARHMDIVEILPRKRDSQGNLIERGMGKEAAKEFLGINVDMSHLSDAQFEELRNLLKAYEKEALPDGRFAIKQKRIWQVDNTKLSDFSLNTTQRSFIASKIWAKVNNELLDLTSFNTTIQKKVIGFSVFARVIKNKLTGETLETFLSRING